MQAVDLMGRDFSGAEAMELPVRLPEEGRDARWVLDALAPNILGGATRLGVPTAFAHMDPPTPWITWATTLWNASLNQNLLHPATAPVARQVEERVVGWLAPFFGMTGGHMTAGSSLANLTALWSARECAGVTEVLASEAAHLSIQKAAHILGLRFRALPIDGKGALIADSLPDDLARTALILTAGTTSTGAIDPLNLAGRAAWTHVDAAWAGPLRLTSYAERIDGIEAADSVAVSAHKWLFQPKESALVLFSEVEKAHSAITFGGAYLATPNVGVLGSHAATAVPLLATLLAWGRTGISARIEHCMNIAERLTTFIQSDARFELYAEPETGIVVWRPKDSETFDRLLRDLQPGAVSTTMIAGQRWIRNVSANPNCESELLISAITGAM